MAANSLYEILELSSSASPDAIRAAYERLTAKYDPDRSENAGNADARVRFEAVKEAFLTLNNPAKRAQYDKTLAMRSQPALQNVEVIEPFWTLPKVIVLAFVLLVGGGYYFKHRQAEARLAAEKAVAEAVAREEAEKARAAAEQARLEAQQLQQERYAEEQQRREREASLRQHSYSQQMESRQEQAAAMRERMEQQRAESQRRMEESRARSAAQQQAARDRAELCRIERERYGRAISC